MKHTLCWLLICLLSVPAFSQHITYNFSAPNAAHHEAEITVLAEGLSSAPAIFMMSRSSPGRYAKHEFGKNVYNVTAADATGKALQVTKDDADVYRVSGHHGVVKLTYALFGNHYDGTYAGIDLTGYHLNMPAAFMWVKGMEKAPITAKFTLPVADWKIATQLKPTTDPATFTAPDLQYFMDSPTKIGKLHWREWTVTSTNNKQYTFRLALEAEAPESLVDSFTEKIKKIVEAGKRVFGEFPDYDYGTYTFIASINPYVNGDGMEHRNSTMITSRSEFEGTDRQLGVFAHEFFHCWNVERIRPKSLEPFNFEKSNMSEALWVAEGFTQYYGSVLMLRAGLSSPEEFVRGMGGIVNAKVNTPGAQLYSPIENSQRAVFTDAGVSIDATNYPNMFTSYYTYGAAIALALDLDLRGRFNKTLDDMMKVLWQKNGKPFVPYTIPDVQNALALTTGDANYAADFFKQYVYGHAEIDYSKLFTNIGYTVNSNGGNAGIGNARLDSTRRGVVVVANTIRNTPLYNAGVDINDIIVTIDDRKVVSPKDLQDALAQRRAGDEVALTYLHRNKPVQTKVVLRENATVRIEDIKAAPTERQLQMRNAWLSQPVK
jgi:predicted metalloprotease with PDZ domain